MHNLAPAYPAMSFIPKRWYVLTVEPGRDSQALRHLAEQGFEAVSLRIYVGWTTRRRTFKDTIELMLPGYLLVHLGPGARWAAVLGSRYVRDVLRLDQSPAPLPVAVAADLMKAMDCTGLVNPHDVRKRPPMRVYEAGQELRITEGPFQSLSARFKARAGERIAVFLKAFGGDIVAEIPEIHVETINGERRS